MKLYAKEIRAGNYIKIVRCSHPLPNDGYKQRAARTKATAESTKLMNRKRARGILELRIAANFDEYSYFITASYDNEHIPCNKNKNGEKNIKKDRYELNRDFRKFIKLIRAVREKRNQSVKYIRVFEGLHGDKRYHVHMILNAVDESKLDKVREELQSLWPYGDLNVCPLYGHGKAGKTPVDVAAYLTKENLFGNSLDERLFVCSRGLLRAEKDPRCRSIYYVDDGIPIDFPSNAIVIDNNSGVVIDQYGRYDYISYLLTSACDGYIKPKYDDSEPIKEKRRRKNLGLEASITK